MQAYSEQQPLVQPYQQQGQPGGIPYSPEQQPYFQGQNMGGSAGVGGIQPLPVPVGPYVPPPIPSQFVQMQSTPLGPPEIRVVSTFEIREGSPEGTVLHMDPQDIYENTHWATQNKLNLFFTVAVWGSLVALIVFGLVLPKRNEYDLIVCGVVFGVAVIVYYIESACSSTRKYLSGMTDPQGILCFHVTATVKKPSPRVPKNG